MEEHSISPGDSVTVEAAEPACRDAAESLRRPHLYPSSLYPSSYPSLYLSKSINVSVDRQTQKGRQASRQADHKIFRSFSRFND
jgi:hypothetical protein